MPPPASAGGMASDGVHHSIINYVVVTRYRVDAAWYIVQIQAVPRFPSDVVVGAGRVATHAYSSYDHGNCRFVQAIDRLIQMGMEIFRLCCSAQSADDSRSVGNCRYFSTRYRLQHLL